MKLLKFVLRVLALTLAYFVTMMIAVAVSGVSSQATSGNAAQGTGTSPAQVESIFQSFLIFSFLVAIVFAWLIARAAWRGLALIATLAVVLYGLGTVIGQIESLVYLRDKMPMALIGKLFVMGAVQSVLFAPLAALIMNRFSGDSEATSWTRPPNFAARLVLLAVVYVCLYYLFGYYVAWQSPELRQFYAGTTELKGFFAQIATAWSHPVYMLPLQLFRGVLWALIGFAVVRMLRTGRLETSALLAAVFGVWSFVLLAPNPYMPARIAHLHLWETLGCDLLLGAITGCVLTGGAATEPAPAVKTAAA